MTDVVVIETITMSLITHANPTYVTVCS